MPSKKGKKMMSTMVGTHGAVDVGNENFNNKERKSNMETKTRMEGMRVMDNVVKEMIGSMVRGGNVKDDVKNENADKTKSEVKKDNDSIELDSMTEGEGDAVDPVLESMLPAETPEQNEELEAVQLNDTDQELEISSVNPLGALSESVTSLEQHEYGKVLPPMSESEFNDFVEDIRKHGLRDKIVMLDGKILDGWNRYMALLRLGIFDPALHCVEYEGNDPAAFVLSKNLHRRHLSLTDSQRAMLVADMETYTHGGSRKNQDGSIHVETRDELAEAAKVSPSSVARAKKIKESSPDDAQDIRDGKTTIGTVIKKVRKAAKDEVQRKKSVKVESAPSKTILIDEVQSERQVSADSIPSEWMQAAKNTWWCIPTHGRYHIRRERISEAIPDAIKYVQRAIDANVLTTLLADLQDVQALVNAGGTALTAEKIDAVFAAREALNEVMEALSHYYIDDLQTWSSIQKGDTVWTPFDNLPSYRKGKLEVPDIVKAVSYVLSSAGWNTERITETLTTLTGNDTMPNGVPMGEEVKRHVDSCANTGRKKMSVKGVKEVRKWLREWKRIDIPEA